MGKKLTRRDFLKLLWFGFVDFFLLSIGGGSYSLLVEPGRFRVENVHLKLKRLSKAFSGLRIAQISDIHMGGWMDRDRLQKVVHLIIRQKPDILLITGDFVIGQSYTAHTKQALNDLVQVLSPLVRSITTFAVLGNHDYWTNAEAVRQMLFCCGITDLTNKIYTLTRNSDHLHFCGVDDIWEGDVRLHNVITQLTDESAAILLAHEPDFADKSSRTNRFDLQISGHSHGGQVVLPIVGAPILPHLGRKYPAGLYRVGNMYQYTNRGVGMGKFPIRLNCPPEITVFQLESVDSVGF